MRRFKILLIIIVVYFGVELFLSGAQWIRYKSEISAYQVTPLLRPWVRRFAKFDLRPRQHSSNGPNWDYATDKMKPGHYPTQDGLPEFTINSYGIRGDEFTIPKPKNIFRILVLGSSSAFGAECRDDETYPKVLEKILQGKIPGKTVEVLNYGMSSKSLYYNARHYFEEADALDPDVVILNNVRNTWFYDQNQGICNYFDIVLSERKFLTRINHFLTDNILAFRLFRRAYESYLFAKWMGPQARYNRYFFDQLYYQALRSMYLDSKSRGAQFMVIKEPYYQDPVRQLYYKKFLNEKLYKVLDGETTMEVVGVLPALIYNNIDRLEKEYSDVMVLDPIEAFIQKEEETPTRDIFIGYSHLSPKGNRLLAEMIAEKLLEETPALGRER